MFFKKIKKFYICSIFVFQKWPEAEIIFLIKKIKIANNIFFFASP